MSYLSNKNSNKVALFAPLLLFLTLSMLLSSCVIEQQKYKPSYTSKIFSDNETVKPNPSTFSNNIKTLNPRQRNTSSEQRSGKRKIIPSWFLNPPKNQHLEPGFDTIDLSLLVTGTGLSSNMQIAIDKSLLAAKRQLADQLNSRLRSTVINILNDTGINAQSYLRSTTKNLIPEVNISGYRKVKSHLIQEGRRYRSFVLIEFPLLNYNNEIITKLIASEIPLEKLEKSMKYKLMKKLRR